MNERTYHMLIKYLRLSVLLALLVVPGPAWAATITLAFSGVVTSSGLSTVEALSADLRALVVDTPIAGTFFYDVDAPSRVLSSDGALYDTFQNVATLTAGAVQIGQPQTGLTHLRLSDHALDLFDSNPWSSTVERGEDLDVHLRFAEGAFPIFDLPTNETFPLDQFLGGDFVMVWQVPGTHMFPTMRGSIDEIHAVPEPSGLVLALCGIAMAGCWARTKRAREEPT